MNKSWRLRAKQNQQIGELPAWLDGKKEEEISSEPTQDLETGQQTPKLEMDFPDWMKEIQPPVSEATTVNENIPAELPEWMRKPDEPATGGQIDEQEPGSWPPGESETPVVPEATAPEEWKPADQVTSVPEDVAAQTLEDLGEAKIEAIVESPSIETTPPPVQAQDKDALLLADARGALEENEPTESMKAYASLIRKNRLLEETIQDLRKASDRHPVDSIVWQTLGDAYMRAGRLQEALDAYTKAEELL